MSRRKLRPPVAPRRTPPESGQDQRDREVLPGITLLDMEGALDAVDAWHHGRHNAAIRIVQRASARGAIPGLVAAFAWITTEVINEFAGDLGAEWQARLRAQVAAPRDQGGTS